MTIISGEVTARTHLEAQDKVREAVHAYAGRDVDYDIERWLVEDASETAHMYDMTRNYVRELTEYMFSVFWEADINWKS